MADTIIARANGAAMTPGRVEPLPAEEVRAIEARAEVDSLGDLHQRRRQLLTVLNPLAALYGPFGLFDDRRKQMLEAMKVKARAALSIGAEKKPTEAQIDAAAYADEQYERFLDDAYAAKIEYLNLANELSELTERIKSRDTELQVYAAELRLAR